MHLAGTRERSATGSTARTDHFMPSSLLDSQIATLEPPGPDEKVLTVDVGRRAAEEADEIIERLHLRPLTTATD